MAEQALTFEEMLDWRDEETEQWREFFRANPRALAVECDIAGTKSVGELVKHVFAVERFFAQRVRDEEPTPFQQMPESAEEQFAIGDAASRKIREYAAGASEEQLQEMVRLPFGGGFDASKRKLIVQFAMHGVRHWAQIATAVRNGGHKAAWPKDFVVSKAMR